MIEATIIGYLINETSAGQAVFAEKPPSPPSKYIIIEKTGGRERHRSPAWMNPLP